MSDDELDAVFAVKRERCLKAALKLLSSCSQTLH
jgi:hypothetical protein